MHTRYLLRRLVLFLSVVMAVLANAQHTPRDLFEYSSLGEIENVSTVLEEGIPIDTQDDLGQTALIIAAKEGHGELVAFLIDETADTYVYDKQGLTAFCHAVAKEEYGIASQLGPLTGEREEDCDPLTAKQGEDEEDERDHNPGPGIRPFIGYEVGWGQYGVTPRDSPSGARYKTGVHNPDTGFDDKRASYSSPTVILRPTFGVDIQLYGDSTDGLVLRTGARYNYGHTVTTSLVDPMGGAETITFGPHWSWMVGTRWFAKNPLQ